ncbi:hypothetical protein E3983_11055 [Legionella israelensis]|uniref:Polysaccharide biosynthesis protein n=1 Tax=Legionella israelensis TaxID=454 RepID=A0AAX1EIB9_9GAMM|nr:hypothetical protein [Legionella israelensis]QBR84841.1 hypothetical protein E3983_11055 [Legionella israelensis]QDP73320.1 hypothetical protein FOG18_12480 [Legionella israelensis]
MSFLFNLFIIIADQLMLFGINVLVARSAGASLFGDFTVATNALYLIATIMTFGIDSIIAYYVPKFYIKERYERIFALTISVKNFLTPIHITILLLGVTLSIAIIALSRALEHLHFFEINHPLMLFLWGAVAISLYHIYIQYLQAIDYMRMSVLLSLLQTVFYFILSLFTYFYLYSILFHHDRNYFPHIMLMAFILSYVLILLTVPLMYKKAKLEILSTTNIHHIQPLHVWKEKIYGYSIQNITRYVFTTIPLLVMEWLGQSEHAVGLFSAVVSIISLAYIGISPIGILIAPDISAAFTQGKRILRIKMKKYLIICLSIAVATALTIGVFAKQILLFFQSNFIDALPYTYIALISIFTYALSIPLARMAQFSRHGNRIGAQISFFLLSLQIIACLILIPWLNLVGAMICYIGSGITYNIILIVIAIKIYKKDTHFENTL